MKLYIPLNGKLKKIHIVLIICIIIFVFFVIFLKNSINSESNQMYIEKIINDDIYLNEKFGGVKGYWLKKVGRNFGPITGESSDIKFYDKYDIYIDGVKNDSLITIRIYKDKEGNIRKSTIIIDGKIYEYRAGLKKM